MAEQRNGPHRLVFGLLRSSLLVSLATLSGCVLWMRDADYYTDELAERLEGESEVIDGCYDRYLAEQDPAAKGRLTVRWEIAAKTGRFESVEVVAAETTVPEPLAACVTDQLATMTLDPVDARTAEATYTWEFARGSRKPRPADPFRGAQDTVLACYSSHLSEVERTATGAVVVDYAFDTNTGAVTRLELVAAETTAPEPVVQCATAALKAATVEPSQLDERNSAGRRTFTLRFEPHVDAQAPAQTAEAEAEPEPEPAVTPS